MLGKGDGSFVSSVILPIASKALLVATGDFNDDGLSDLAVTRENGGISLMLNRATCVPAKGGMITSAGSFAGRKLAPESVAVVFGSGLTTTTRVAQSLPLPTRLEGVIVLVTDGVGTVRLAPIFSISPQQINFLIPAGSALGAAIVEVKRFADNAVLASGTFEIVQSAPALFTANSAGYGLPSAVVVRIRADGSTNYEPVARFDSAQNRTVPVPVDLGATTDQVILALFGSGARNRKSLQSVQAKIGGETAEVLFVGKQGSFEGLDQFNVRVPNSLRGRGEVEVLLTVDGRASNPVKLVFK